MASDLPPGVTEAMCDTACGQAIDENTLCGCGHPLHMHEYDNENYWRPIGDKQKVEPCTEDDCECTEFTDDYEPDDHYYDDD